VPQLLSVTLSTAKPRKPSFRHVFVNLADPAQTSMINNSSKGTPSNFLTGQHGLLLAALGDVASCDTTGKLG